MLRYDDEMPLDTGTTLFFDHRDRRWSAGSAPFASTEHSQARVAGRDPSSALIMRIEDLAAAR
jgi:hypothetical protein